MNNPRLAGRYAKSLVDLATAQQQLDAIFADMKWLHGICKSNPDFVSVLRSPVINPGIKAKVINAIVEGKINATTNAFIQLLVRKGREHSLPEITHAFIDQYNSIKGIRQLKLTTATPISDEMKKAIVSKVTGAEGMNQIEIETAVKEELIGGFVLEMEGKLVDASILRDLNDIRKQFLDNQYIHKLR